MDGEDITVPGSSAVLDRDQRERDFERFVAAESGALLRLARRLLRDPDEARDLVQDALWKAYRSLDGFRGDSSLKSWMWRITVNEGMKRLRRRQRWKSVTMWLGINQRYPIGQEENLATRPDQQAERNKRVQALQRALARLPARQQMAVVLRYMEDRSVEEISVELGIAPGTVKTHLIRAIRQLRNNWPAQEDFDVAV